MHRIQNLKHQPETFYFCLSRLLERGAYYGLRGLLVLYMVGETLKMESKEALFVYGWLSTALIFTQVLGGLFGDLLIGNKRTIILGAMLQALGSFVLCIPSLTGLYAGLFLVVMGSGFYSPNITSNYGKHYLNKTQLLDGAFTLFYVAINIGAMIGVLLIGYLGDAFSFKIGFIAAGIVMLLSLLPLINTKDINPTQYEASKYAIEKRLLNILLACILLALFWAVYELSSFRIQNIQAELSGLMIWDIPQSWWYSINSAFLLPLGIIAAIVWSYFYNSQSFKLMMGFFLAALSFGLLFLIPETPNENHIILYLFSIFVLNASEIHLAPILHSILTKYSNPKYLAIIVALSSIPYKLLTFVSAFLYIAIYDNPSLGLKYGFIILCIISIGLLVYVIFNRKNT